MFRVQSILATTVLVVAPSGCKPSSATPVARELATTNHVHHDRGAIRGLEAELAPARVLGDRLELRLDLASHFEAAGRARWAVEIVDDAGVAIGAPSIEAPVALAGRGTHTATIATPERLADGFYVVRVTAVAKAGAASDVAVLERYLEVHHGDVTPIDSGDYYTRSRARIGGVL